MKTQQPKTCGSTVKAVLREKFIAIQAYLKTQEKSQINNLTLYLKQLEKEEMKRWSQSTEVKNPHANVGSTGSIPGSGRSPGEGNSNHSSNLAWEIPLTEEPGGLQPMGLRKSQIQFSD